MPSAAAHSPRTFHVMAKPSGSQCNLDCTYCFYLEKAKLYPDQARTAMPDEVLESFVRQYIASQSGPVVTFAWQGGEPTLMGLPFFERAVALQKQYADGRHIDNAFQTNGVLLDDRWGAFLAEHRFLVGLSIDGPRDLHDRYRVDRGSHPTFDRVMRGLEVLKRHNVAFNTLTCINRQNARKPLEVYRFLREIGSGHIQFIPIVERLAAVPSADGLTLPLPEDPAEARVAPFTVGARDYGAFLCAVFDEWVRYDVGRVYVQGFEVALGAWLGQNPSLCVYSRTCGDAMAIEHNGDLYACDHYVYPEYRLGNILETPLVELAASPSQHHFGQDKCTTLPRQCRECPVRFACNGGCPKHRFCETGDGEPGLNYLCPGYFAFFTHIDAPMRFMANQLRHGASPAAVMAWMRQRDRGTSASSPDANAPCPCGSGRKYKKCCGRAVR